MNGESNSQHAAAAFRNEADSVASGVLGHGQHWEESSSFFLFLIILRTVSETEKTSKAGRVSLSGVELRMGLGLNVQRYGEDVVNAGLQPTYPFKSMAMRFRYFGKELCVLNGLLFSVKREPSKNECHSYRLRCTIAFHQPQKKCR